MTTSKNTQYQNDTIELPHLNTKQHENEIKCKKISKYAENKIKH